MEDIVLDEEKLDELFNFNKLSKKQKDRLIEEIEFLLETEKRQQILHEIIDQRMKQLEELKSIDKKDKLFNEEKYSKFTSMLDSNQYNTIDVDKLVNMIDEKIAKLEAEEKNM